MDKTVAFNEECVTVFIGNLPLDVAEKDIRYLMEQYGPVNSLRLITHRESGQFQGICFAEMPPGGAENAIHALNGEEFGGRRLRVRLVKKEDIEDTAPT